MITLDLIDDELQLRCSDMMTGVVRDLPGLSYSRQEGAWTGPFSPLAVEAAYRTLGQQLELTPAVTARMSELMAQYQMLEAIKAGAWREQFMARFPEQTAGLWPLQVDAVAHMVTAPVTYECDPMGTGKTICTYRALDVLVDMGINPYPVFVVANKSALRTAWRDEGHQWCRSLAEVVVVDGTAKQRRDDLEFAKDLADSGMNVVVVIGWGTLQEHSMLSGFGNYRRTDKQKQPRELQDFRFQTLVADEAHKAKNYDVNRTRALWSLGDQLSVERRWELTGTPVTGYPQDVWALGHLGQPEWYGSRNKWRGFFLNTYTPHGARYEIVNGFEPQGYDIMIRHLEPFMVRRPKELIIPNYQGKLPPVVLYSEMKPKQRKAYDQMADEMLAEGEGGILAASGPMERLLRLNQFAAATPMVGEVVDESTGEVTIGVTELQMPSAKVDTLFELIDSLQGEQAVVFAESRLLIDLVERELDRQKDMKSVTHARITGNEDGLAREAAIAGFQAGDVQIMLCTYGAAAESITLNRADIVIRLQRTYNWVLDEQAPDRVDRGERSVPVTIYDIVTLGTAEHDVHERLDEKGQISEEVLRDAIRV